MRDVEAHRMAAERRGLRHPGNMNDSGWTLIAPLIPPACRGGRLRDVNLREVPNAIFYVLANRLSTASLAEDRAKY
jgi:transposase